MFLAWIATVTSETAFRFMVIVTTSCPILTIVDVDTAARSTSQIGAHQFLAEIFLSELPTN